MEDDSEAIQNLRESIMQSLSPSAMINYDSLVEDFTLDRIGESETTTPLQRFLEKDELLHQRFLEVTNELKEEQEDGNGETLDGELTDIEDSTRDPTKIEADLQIRVKVGENAKEDPPVHGESKIDADLENRVKVDKNPEEDVTDEPKQMITPSYTLIPEKDRSPVSETVLNNEFRLVKVDTPGCRKLAGYKKPVADYEDDMYQKDMMIEGLTSAVESWEKVMRREMRIEDVREKFYTCIQELDGGTMVTKLRQNYQEALPVILDRLKEKLNYLRSTRKKRNRDGSK